MNYWIVRGVGFFYVVDIEGMEGEYYGEFIFFKMCVVFVFFGD